MPVTLRTCTRSLVLITLAASSGCQSTVVQSAANAIGARAAVLAMTESEEQQLGAESYREILATSKPTAHREYQQIVERVGRRIAASSGKQGYDWEFTVLAGPTQNAFCLPGGKVAVYEGLLPLCENEAGLAVVMAHEVAHALARHGGERMRNQALADAVGEVLDSTTADNVEARRRLMLQGVYGAASQVGVLLPFSRAHESEADSIGLILMARAGYDPSEAPRFWRRFRTAKGGSLPEIFSTHPADERRAADLEDLLPQAEAYYKAAPRQFGLGETLPRPALAQTTAAAQGSAAATSLVPPAVLPPRNSEVLRASVSPAANVEKSAAAVVPAAVELPAPAAESGADADADLELAFDPFLGTSQAQKPPEFEPPAATSNAAQQPIEDSGWIPSTRQLPQIEIEGPAP